MSSDDPNNNVVQQSVSDLWVSTVEAAAMLTQQSGHRITPTYVRRLGQLHKLTMVRFDGRTKLYSKDDVSKYVVRKRGSRGVIDVLRELRGV